MKNLIILLIGLFLLVSPVYSTAFQTLSSGTTNPLHKVVFTDNYTGYVVGSFGTILKTTNGGINWFPLSSNTTTTLNSVYFLNPTTGWVVGNNGIILKTTNAGLNWLISYSGSASFSSVYFLNALTGWAVGEYAACLKTTNGGTNWFNQLVAVGSSSSLSSVVFNNNKGFITATDSLNLFTTTNEGSNWVGNGIRSGGISNNEISFSGNFGITVGGEFFNPGGIKPVLFVTTNNGQSWTERTLFNRNAVLIAVRICQSNTNICYAVGQYRSDSIFNNKGLIMSSTNGGQTWLDEAWTNNIALYGIAVTGTDVYIVGDHGVILKSPNPIGIRQIGTEVPDKYLLSQNYPNPFNPTTNIEFSAPKKGSVRISVFDMTGREVATLINEVLSIGKYRVDFNASNLSSGTYFYKLTAEGYSSVKKMVLVK